MAHIELEPIEHGDEDIRAVFEATEDKWGYVPEIVRALAIRPAVLEAEDAWTEAVMHEGLLDRSLKELVATTVSATNDCAYCASSHAYQAAVHGASGAAVNACRRPETAGADLGPAEREAIRFARAAVEDGRAVSQADIDRLTAHFTREEIVELVLVIASFQLYNTFATLLGLEPEAELATRLDSLPG